MKYQNEFGDEYDNRSPFDFDFGDPDSPGSDPMAFPNEVEIVHCLVHKARAEVIAVDDDYDRLREFGRGIGIWQESTIVSAPFGLDIDEIEFPTLP